MKKQIDKWLGNILVVLMVAMTLDVLWGVLTRYALGSQADWSEELARFLLIWIGILGAAYAAGQHMHLAIDILLKKFTGRARIRMILLIHLMVIIFAVAVLIIGGMRLILLTQLLGQLSAALRIPMYLVYSVLPIAGVLVLYYKVHDIGLLIRQKENAPIGADTGPQ